MDAEIITLGDELMTGHTVDSNAAFIAQRLTDAGITVKYQSSVGDNPTDMEEAFNVALKRVHVVIVTGGLGPTEDDVTKRAIVKVFKRNLVFHEDVLDTIKARYKRRGIEMPAINQNQALLPQGAKLFPNKFGSAVGICIAEHGRVFVALPGVPDEMRQILVDEVIPYLLNVNSGQAIKVYKLRTTGIVESRLSEMLAPDLKLEQGVKLAYLPSYSGVDLRVIATASNAEEADTKARAVVRYIESLCGKYIYGHGEDTLEGTIGQLLVDNDKTVSVAESCTGGQLGMAITSVAGSSRYFVGGIIAYSNEVKADELGVNREILEQHGAVSEECAIAMAAGCRQKFGTDYALSVTGIAGPDGGTDEKPVGTVYIGLASAHANYARLFKLGTERNINRSRTVYIALELLRRDILDIK